MSMKQTILIKIAGMFFLALHISAYKQLISRIYYFEKNLF